MLGSIRKFSTTIYAKILLAIVIIPFVFWGMGNVFTGGNKNVIVKIDDDKFSIQTFAKFVKENATAGQEINSKQIEGFLTFFISEKIIEKEVKELGINLNDVSLSKLIKHQKSFQRDNKFSRTEYEKYLIKNNTTAINFEKNFSKLQKKKQLLDFIGKGLAPTKSLINASYNEINQKRYVEVINLNNYFKKKLNFTDDEINNYFKMNNKKFNETYKSISLIELSPKLLTASEEYSNLFFSLIDEIDDLIVQGEDLNFLTTKFNLGKKKSYFINKDGKDLNLKKVIDMQKSLLEEVFDLNDSETLTLIEKENKYFIIEIAETKNVKRKISDNSTKSKVLEIMTNERKRKINGELADKINQDNFKKNDFDKLGLAEDLKVEKFKIENANDFTLLKEELVNEIYSFVKNKVVLVNDIFLLENYLIFINKIENVSIDTNSKEYEKYAKLSEIKITNGLYNTYDNYIKKKYKIDINYQALDTIKNNFN